MDGRSNRRNKAAFSNSSGVMCTGPEKSRFLSFLGVIKMNVVCLSFSSGSQEYYLKRKDTKSITINANWEKLTRIA